MEQSTPSTRDYWFDEDTDKAMEGEHLFVWRTMLGMVEDDLDGARVLDIGCSTGGFLRLLVDELGIGAGCGFDPAAGPVAIARERRDGRPLEYEAATEVPPQWSGFDVAFSHEVLFVLPDLASHAAQVWRSLRPGGSYYAVFGTHDRNPSMADWHASVREQLSLPPVRSLEDVASAFTGAGFEAHLGRMRFGLLPLSLMGDTDLGTVLDYYDRHKVIFRFVRGS